MAYCLVVHLLSKCALLVLGKKPLMELARYLASAYCTVGQLLSKMRFLVLAKLPIIVFAE